MKRGIVALGFLVFLIGIALAAYSKTITLACIYGVCSTVTVYPDQQAGIAVLVIGIVCMAVGAALDR